MDTSLSEENLELKIQMEFKRVGLEEIIQRVRVGRKGPEHRVCSIIARVGKKRRLEIWWQIRKKN